MTQTLEPPTLTNTDRRTASAWYQFIRVWHIETEHVSPLGWRVSQQNYITLGKKPDPEPRANLMVVQTMTTPDGGRFRPYEVLAAIQSLSLEYRLKLDAIRCDTRAGGRGSTPTELYPQELGSPQRRARDVIARACLALRVAMKNTRG